MRPLRARAPGNGRRRRVRRLVLRRISQEETVEDFQAGDSTDVPAHTLRMFEERSDTEPLCLISAHDRLVKQLGCGRVQSSTGTRVGRLLISKATRFLSGSARHPWNRSTATRKKNIMVQPLQLSLAVGRYAITLPLVDGTIGAEGVELTPLVLPSPERHWRMLRHREFDVGEVSMAGFMRAFEEDPQAWTAIPVFPHRRFRHGYVFVADKRFVGQPQELANGAIGLRTWATSAGVWLRGILQDDHGIDLQAIRWVTEHAEHVPGGDLDRFQITRAPDGAGLVELLLAGELDALIYPERPIVREGTSGSIHRLFPDPRGAEMDYFRRQSIFPIMHTVAIRRSLAERHPWAPTSLLKAFEAAKQQAYQRLRDPRWIPLAWVEAAVEEQTRVLGPDPWPYGYHGNAKTLGTLMRYAVEQGLVRTSRDPEDYFWPSSLSNAPVYVAASRRPSQRSRPRGG